MSTEDAPDLGPCCICEGTRNVRNLLMLPRKSPYGIGWGCLTCGLSTDGATAIICDRCADELHTYNLDPMQQLRFFARPEAGGSYVNGRAPIAELREAPPHMHDMTRHPDE